VREHPGEVAGEEHFVRQRLDEPVGDPSIDAGFLQIAGASLSALKGKPGA